MAVRRTPSLSGGVSAAAAAQALGSVLGHPDVVALQVALLERLMVHAGVPLPSEGDGAGGGNFTGGSRGGHTWALTRFEARHGAFVAEAPPNSQDRRPRRSSDADAPFPFHVVQVSLIWWRVIFFDVENGSPPPVLGLPTPLEQARLAAGTAEALCRLWRGQGLRGAFGPSGQVTWRSGLAEFMRCTFLEAPVESLSEAAVHDCTPYWVEAGCWGVALAVEALAAQLEGRLVIDVPASAHPEGKLEHGSPAHSLQYSLKSMEELLNNPRLGFRSLGAASREELSGRLQRCGLGASLDRALRLAFTSLDRGVAAVAPTGSEVLTAASARACTLIPYFVGRILRTGLLSVLSPSAGDGTATAAAEGGQRGRQAVAGTAGMLVTAVKRARALTALLEGLAASAAATRSPAPEVLESGAKVLYCVLWGARALRLQMRERAAGPAAAPASACSEPACGGGGEGPAAGLEPGRGLLALALRSACGLGTQLAFAVSFLMRQPVGAAGGGTGAHAASSPNSTLGTLEVRFAAGCTAFCLDQLAATGRPDALGGSLTAQQLLACQPHRLLAAAAAMLCAAPASGPSHTLQLNAEVRGMKRALAQGLTSALVTLPARPELSDRIQAWLELPQPLTAAFASGRAGRQATRWAARVGDDRGAPPTDHSCLFALLQAAVTWAAALEAHSASSGILALLYSVSRVAREARGRGSSGSSGESGASGGGGTLQQVAASMMEDIKCAHDLIREVDLDCELPPIVEQPPGVKDFVEGLRALDHPAQEGLFLMTVLINSLPPPLAVPAMEETAPLGRLRMCGNPRCVNFSGACEAELGLRQCAGCRVVRYCGAACQRADWQQHRAACADVKAATGAGAT
ncbi:hypothetical protein GPECTOR_76g814 [Gonium pectorale]|uniref:MYND-type domain-containing protein n=1 Tax=Gonium pectorale TaxID=33097 RepID=A0A150G2G5_GONPE|nr:hypothetical protein GPECTOR_76g814 [Gonium pectorale]|eukprot:KXZ43991.1 hypothetical protein GPECTOR_76g814 [Gonium pectorale]